MAAIETARGPGAAGGVLRVPWPSVAVAVAACAAGFAWLLPKATSADLAPMFIAARLIALGEAAHVYANFERLAQAWPWIAAPDWAGVSDMLLPYLYPPLWAALLAPVSFAVGFETVRALALAVNLAAVAATAVVAAAQWHPALLRPWRLALLLGLLALTFPVFHGLTYGQVQPVVTLLVVVAIAASQRARPGLAGAALALAAAVKLFPAVLALYWACTGRRTAALWCAGVLAALGLASLATGGLALHADYLDALARVQGRLMLVPNNQGLYALFGSLLHSTAAVVQHYAYPAPAGLRLAVAAIGLAGAALIVHAARAARPSRDEDAMAMAALYVLAFVAAPLAWAHYYIVAIVPALILARRGDAIAAGAIAVFLSLPLYHLGVALAERGMALLLWGELGAGLALVAAGAWPLARRAFGRRAAARAPLSP